MELLHKQSVLNVKKVVVARPKKVDGHKVQRITIETKRGFFEISCHILDESKVAPATP
jgi:hypothetical protein